MNKKTSGFGFLEKKRNKEALQKGITRKRRGRGYKISLQIENRNNPFPFDASDCVANFPEIPRLF